MQLIDLDWLAGEEALRRLSVAEDGCERLVQLMRDRP